GTLALATFHSIAAPTLAATNAGVTTTDASTLYIAGAPITGTNQTISNASALHIASGNVTLSGGELLLAGNLLPGSHGDYDLGKAGLAMRNIYTTDLTVLSDRRFKSDIAPLERGLDEVMALEPVSYRLKADEGRKRLGFIAQDLSEVVREVVHEGGDPAQTLGIHYTELVPVLTRAIQEQEGKIRKQGRILERQRLVTESQRRVLEEQKKINLQLTETFRELRSKIK
ncbi:MAG: tail fiber domain-containing protein, partial [Planctomycetes bacterium]|nr:tail fiber domain-containing protein [Planctomycetota bacterium]